MAKWMQFSSVNEKSRAEKDQVARFVYECTEHVDTLKDSVAPKDLYAAYKQWALNDDYVAPGQLRVKPVPMWLFTGTLENEHLFTYSRPLIDGVKVRRWKNIKIKDKVVKRGHMTSCPECGYDHLCMGE